MTHSLSLQNFPDHFFAGFWIRFFAYGVDLLVIGSLTRILAVPFVLLGSSRTLWSLGPIDIGLAAIVFPAYFVLFTKLSQGKTLGKIIFGLRVVCFKEDKLTWTTVLIREFFGRYFQHVVMFFYLIAAFTPKKQHLADLLTDTSVLSEVHLKTWKMAQESLVQTG